MSKKDFIMQLIDLMRKDSNLEISECDKGIKVQFVDDIEESGVIINEGFIDSLLIEGQYDLNKTFDLILSQIEDIKKSKDINQFPWKTIKDLIIIVPQLKDEDMSEFMVSTSKSKIPLNEFGMVGFYAINLETQLIFVTKEMLKEWSVLEEDIYDLAIENISRMIKFEENSFVLGDGITFVYKTAVSNDNSIISSALFLLERRIEEFNETGIIVSVPTRNQLIITDLNNRNMSFMSMYSLNEYHKEVRYKKLQYPIAYLNGDWGVVVPYETVNN